jgi:hypothetical protein
MTHVHQLGRGVEKEGHLWVWGGLARATESDKAKQTFVKQVEL